MMSTYDSHMIEYGFYPKLYSLRRETRINDFAEFKSSSVEDRDAIWPCYEALN